MEYKSRSIRLSDEVWDALQKSELSANQILRNVLLGSGGPIEIESPGQVPKVIKKLSKKEQAVRDRATGDIAAKLAERDNIDYSDVESTPTTNVVNLKEARRTAPPANTLTKWRASRRPLPKPNEQ